RTSPRPQPGPVQINMAPQTVSDAYDSAKALYQQGRLAEAEAMTQRAIELLRASMPASTPVSRPSNPNVTVVGGEIREPKRIKFVDPIYPEIARAASVEGYVTIEARIAKDGSVRDARVISGQPLLNDAALGAVRQWLYSPTQLNGQPVEVMMTVTIVF